MEINKQQMFDKVCTHFSLQKRSTWSIDGQCTYRSLDGLMCPVGCLLSDEQLKRYGSYKGPVALLEAHARQSGDLETADFLQANLVFLQALQDVHDGDMCDIVEMQNRLLVTARTFSLNPEFVAQIEEWNG